jgi:hypothetical protein
VRRLIGGLNILFLIASLVTFYVIAILIPKRISWLQIWSTSLFSLVVESMSDMTLDLKLNLFGYIAPGDQWSGFLPIFLYPPVNTIFLNYYPYESSKFEKLVYIVGWTDFVLLMKLLRYVLDFFTIKNGNCGTQPCATRYCF